MLVPRFHALLCVALEVHSLVADRLELVQMLNERNDELCGDEELKVSLLVDVSFGGTPADQRIT